MLKSPPAYRSVPDTTSALTRAFIPEPKADQVLPSHLAIYLAEVPPAMVKSPPAYRSLPDTARALTSLAIPDPMLDQTLPSHRARKTARSPPALVNQPPAYRALPDTTSAETPRHPFPSPRPTTRSHSIWQCCWPPSRP